jgi:phenolic acid decarboxylase
VQSFNEKYEILLEQLGGYKSIKKISRFFYPKNIDLSPEFIACFKKEHARLVDTGVKPDIAVQRIAKALLFHSRF